MGSDVIERWERAKYDPCNGPAGLSDLKHAGDDVASELKATRDLLNRANRYSDQIAAELESCRDERDQWSSCYEAQCATSRRLAAELAVERGRTKRAEALLFDWSKYIPGAMQTKTITDELRAALTAPASKGGSDGE